MSILLAVALLWPMSAAQDPTPPTTTIVFYMPADDDPVAPQGVREEAVVADLGITG